MAGLPRLTLVKDCGSLLNGSPIPRVNVGAQFVPADATTSSGLNNKDFLSRHAPAFCQPLPNHPLGNPDLIGKVGLSNAVSLEVGRQVHEPILATLVHKVNSKLLDSSRRTRDGRPMKKGKRPRPGAGISKDVMIAEGKALSRLWKTHRHRSQEDFSTELGFTQGNFSHYIGARRPIPLEVGIAIAEELKIELSELSPRLAAEYADLRNQGPVKWPFADLTPERLLRLSPGQLKQIEGRVMEEIEQIEQRRLPRPRSA